MGDNPQAKILIVDDQDGIRQLLKEVFKSADYAVYTAANGDEALGLAGRVNFELVMLDMKLPGLSGIQILEKLKQIQPGTKVIMMTAYEEAHTVGRAISLGAECCVFKPFDIFEVKHKADRLIFHE